MCVRAINGSLVQQQDSLFSSNPSSFKLQNRNYLPQNIAHKVYWYIYMCLY